ncbi:MAG: class I SAM-dependent RNA methyltransferase [Treponemataceae bacterium]|nr:class I SAM-dependent RNA methyltransferase [Treponemataceae bacterium]
MITLVALCALGAEKVLGNEIRKLDYKPVQTDPGRVAFTCPEEGIYRSNLCLRTADRVYLQMASFRAPNFDALFDGIYAVPWQDYFKKDTRVVVDKVRSHGSALSSEHSIQGMAHKAIYKKLGDVWHMSVMPETGDEATVRIYLEKNQATVLLDLSGAPLNKRGYRTEGGVAPLRETTAAVLLQLMCWRRKIPLHDPFCGSGTIAIEAALYAYNVAPGFGRRFAFETLAFFDPDLWLEIRRNQAAKITPENQARITGSDIDGAAVERARINAEHACVTAGRALQLIGSDMRIQRPDFTQADFKDLQAPYEEGLLLGNPPYGERLGEEEEALALYSDMHGLLEAFPDWKMGFITSCAGFEEAFGKKAASQRKIKCGNLDTVFYMY